MAFSAQQSDYYDVDLDNEGFFPRINIAEWQCRFSIDSRKPASVLQDIVQGAMIAVNRDLSNFRCAQMDAGYLELSKVPCAQIGTDSELIILYVRAVHNRAAAEYLAEFADYATTDATDVRKSGAQRVASKQELADQYYASAIRAIRLIKGDPETHVALV